MTQGIQLTVTGSELTKMCEAQAAIQQKNAVDEKESKAKYLNSLSPKDHAAYSSGYRDPGYEKAAECWRFLATHFVPMDNYLLTLDDLKLFGIYI
jgi:hypothetical protein